MTLAIGDDARYLLVSFPPSEVAYSVTVPEGAALRFAIGRQFPPCDSLGTFTIGIEAEGGPAQALYQRELRAGNGRDPVGWYEEEISLTAYANQAVRLTFRNDAERREVCNWFLWADPVIVVRP